MSFGLWCHLLDVAEQEDRRRDRIRRNIMRNSRWDAFNMPERDFVKTYRLSKALAASLIEDLAPFIPRERRRDALSIKSKVLTTLGFLASGSYQTLVGQSVFHGVSQPTVSRAVRQVVEAMNRPEVFKKFLFFPRAREARDKIKQSFYNKYKLPGVIGCIDGTHVALLKPKDNEERYINRKGYHSLNVMIICDNNLNILCVDPSNPGSTHDSTVWNEHPLKNYIEQLYENGETVFFLGDSGYPLRRTMMTPYLNAAEGSQEEHYYNVLVSARNVVERCIGVLKARFRCLLVARKLHYSPVIAGKMVNACTILHNMANRARIPVPNLSSEEEMAERQEQFVLRQAECDFVETLRQIEVQDNHQHHSRNQELNNGRLAQQAVIQRLWTERMGLQ